MNYPSEWKTEKLRDVVEIIRGSSPRPKSDPRYFGGDIPWVKISDITSEPGKYLTKTIDHVTEEGAKKSRLLKSGTLILSNSATVCVPKIMAVDGCIHDGFVAFPNLPAWLNKEFLYYFFDAIRPQVIQDNRQGMTQVNLNIGLVGDFDLPLPPLAEQELIVERIESLFSRLDAGVAALKRVQAALKRYRTSVLKAACEGRLVPQDPEDEPAEELLKRILAEKGAKSGDLPEGLPDLPAGWCWVRMEQLGTHRLGKMLDKEKNTGSFHPYLRNANVRWFGFDLSDLYDIRVTDEELDTIVAQRGDLIVCEGGEPGRAAVWDTDEKIVIQKALHRLRPYQGVLPKYLVYRLASDASAGILEEYFTGSTIKHFTGESFRSYQLPLPPTKEQNRIVEEIERQLTIVQQLESSVSVGLTRAARLRQSILKRAFEGRLVETPART